MIQLKDEINLISSSEKEHTELIDFVSEFCDTAIYSMRTQLVEDENAVGVIA